MLRWIAGSLAACLLAGPAGIWLDVPFVKQEKNGCGAASIAMVLRYWTKGADAAQIQQALYHSEAPGIRASDMEHYFQAQGFRTFLFRGASPDLKEHLSKGRPLIACLKPGARSTLHYVVVVGLDSNQDLVLLNDPAQRKLLKIDRATFEKQWSGADHWTLLAVPAQTN